MSTSMLGADADELERQAQALRAAADELDAHAGSVTSTLRSVAWVGGVATRFGSQWGGGHRPRIHSTAQYVRDAAAQLDRNAGEQRQASRVGGTSGTAGPGGSDGSDGSGGSGQAGSPPTTSDPSRPEVADRIAEALEILGVHHSDISLIADIAEDLADNGVVGELIDILTDKDFVNLLDNAGHFLDVGAFVVDTVTDFAENPGLPFDERIVHSLADAAVRFGLDQGMEKAAEFLAGAATTALLPGFGAILAPFIGNIAGAIAGEVMDVVVEAVDGATDFVDSIADAVVDAYQNAKEVFGVVADVAEAAADVAGAAWDLTTDAAGAVVDAGGAVVGGIADAGGSVIDAGGDVVGAIGGLFD